MRVAILHSQYLSGAVSGENRVVEDEARLLREAGHEVTVWSQSVDLKMSKFALGARAVWGTEALRRVNRIISDFDPEIIHIHNLFPNLSPAVLRNKGQSCAAVMTLHNYRLQCLPGTLLRDDAICVSCVGKIPWRGVAHRCYRDSAFASAAVATSLTLHKSMRSFDRIDKFLAVSEFVRNQSLKGGLNPSKVIVKPNFSWPAKRRKGPGSYFLFAGRLSPEKGVETLLRIWRGVKSQLKVAGDGPLGMLLKSRASSSVDFLGPVGAAEVSALLTNARALLVPSVWLESSPRIVIEAFASGVPVVASALGGLPELVADGEVGLLVDPHDDTQWANALDRLMEDRESERLGDRAYKAWLERFSPRVAIRKLEAAYADSIKRAHESQGTPN